MSRHPLRHLGRSLALFVTGALVLSAPLCAQDADQLHSRLELSGFAGRYIGGTLYAVPAIAGRTGRVSGQFTFGGRLTYNLSPGFAVEASYARTRPDVGLVDSSPPTSHLLGRVTLDQVDLDMIFAYSSPKEAIYFAVGGGATAIKPELTGLKVAQQTKFALNAGLGYKRWLTSILGFRADLRIRGTKTSPGSSTFCDSSGNCFTYNRTFYSNGELTTGLMFGF
jgi:opacity protein-like surface antigen